MHLECVQWVWNLLQSGAAAALQRLGLASPPRMLSVHTLSVCTWKGHGKYKHADCTSELVRTERYTRLVRIGSDLTSSVAQRRESVTAGFDGTQIEDLLLTECD